MRNLPLQVGITGGIGSGKSIVCNIFRILGIPVYDADKRAKWLANNHPEVKKLIISYFGEEAFLKGSLNRQFLAGEVFSNAEKLEKLNSFIHPKVAEDYKNWVNEHKEYPYLLKEAALLFESDSYKKLHKIITVFAPEKVRINRILVRDPQRTTEEIQNIINKQLPEKEKLEKADFIIKNDERTLVTKQVLEIHDSLLEASRKHQSHLP